MIVRADAARIPLANKSVRLTVGSPPYVDCRTYSEGGGDLGIARDCRSWVSWMLRVTAECLRVTDGAVVWIASGATRDRDYWPACEGLMWRWFDEGWTERGPGTAPNGSSYRPCYWHRIGISGSGGDQWYRADVEYAMCFKRPGSLPYADPKANGHAPKWAPGGAMSYRKKDGTRKEKGEARRAAVAAGVGKTMSPRDSSHWAKGDERGAWNYVPPDISNPGNLLHTTTGGGRLGHELAHDNEAPFPVSVPAFWMNSHSEPGSLVMDPFSGGGTSWQAATELERRFVGFDLRESQCRLARRRLATVTPSLPFAESAR